VGLCGYGEDHTVVVDWGSNFFDDCDVLFGQKRLEGRIDKASVCLRLSEVSLSGLDVQD
jgi:hypothetical protein